MLHCEHVCLSLPTTALQLMYCIYYLEVSRLLPEYAVLEQLQHLQCCRRRHYTSTMSQPQLTWLAAGM